MKNILRLFLSFCVVFALASAPLAQTAHGEGLRNYKKQKHRKLKKNASGEVVKKTCRQAYLDTCYATCTSNVALCKNRCNQNVGAYCRARATKRSKAKRDILLMVLALALGPVTTIFDAPRTILGPDEWEGLDPYTFVWNHVSYNLDLGVGVVGGSAYGISAQATFRWNHFGFSSNIAYLNESGETLGEFDIGPTFYVGSKHISSGIQPSLIGSAGNGIKPEFGYGLRTTTTYYFNPFIVVFSPLLGSINNQVLFHLKVGAGLRLNPGIAAYLAFEHRSVVDLNDLFISTAGLNGVFAYISFRTN